MKSALPWKLLSVLITGVLIFFSLKVTFPFKLTVSEVPYSDPLVHIFSFGTLMYCYCKSWESTPIRITLGMGLVALGIGLEALQATLWDFKFEFEDALANTLGVGLGFLLGYLRKH